MTKRQWQNIGPRTEPPAAEYTHIPDDTLRARMAGYKFYHIIPLTETLSTPGNPLYVPAQQLFLKHMRTLDLAGKRVLDIGCRDGLFSFEAEKLGAQVIGIDNDLSKPAVEFLIPYFHSSVQMFEMNLLELTPDHFGRFDVVLFPGVLYHLRYPFWALQIIRNILKVGGVLLTETAIWNEENDNALLFCPSGQDSPYEPSSCTFFNVKGLVDTLAVMGFETTTVEPLSSQSFSRRRRQLFARIQMFLNGKRPPIRNVERCVFVSRFVGVDPTSRYWRYWEGNHAIHTAVGG